MTRKNITTINITTINKSILNKVESGKSSVERGKLFLEWILSYIFEKTDDEIENNLWEEGCKIIDGSYDGGIDAAFIENGRLNIIQSKYGSSYNKDELMGFSKKMELLLKKANTKNKKQEVFEIINKITEVEETVIYYITNNTLKEEQKNIEKLEESFNSIFLKNNIKLKFLGEEGISEFINDSLNQVPKKFQGKEIEILVNGYFINNENTTIIAEVSLKELARFIAKGNDYIFYSNIRNFLGRNKINKYIEKTYKENPKNFWYYNNGITIVCDSYNDVVDIESKKSKKAKIKIKTPQIVNGCQTASTIYRNWEKEDEETKENKEGTILIKIIKDTNNKRKDITKYTNSQTAVTGKDFFSLEDFHKQLKKDFEKLGYNYEIQRKEMILKSKKGNKKYSYLFENSNFNNKLNSKEVVQAFTAGIHFKSAKARNTANIVPGGSYYDKLFNDINTQTDPRYYLFPYGVMFYGKNTLQHKDDSRMKASNLLYVSIYFMLIMEIFKRNGIISKELIMFIEEEKSIEYLNQVFVNEKENKILLKSAHNILKDFYKDSQIKKNISDNLPKFLKSTIENNSEVKEILKEKINDEIEDNNLDEKVGGFIN